MRGARRTLPVLLTALLLLAGCGGAKGVAGGAAGATSADGAASTTSSAAGATSADGAASTTSSAAGGVTSTPGGGASTTTAGQGPSSSSSSASTWGALAGCPSVGRPLPPGTRSARTIDVDGDGRPDTAFIATAADAQGSVAFGVRTASGGVLSATIRSASPAARSVLFADVTGHGEVIALASDGRQVQLWAVSDCSLVPIGNQQGAQYTFDLGFTGYGTGVGCADANGDGVPDLLDLKLDTDGSGRSTQVERTIITLNGLQARNGARSTVPVSTTEQAQLATSVSCGNLTMSVNGVTE